MPCLLHSLCRLGHRVSDAHRGNARLTRRASVVCLVKQGEFRKSWDSRLPGGVGRFLGSMLPYWGILPDWRGALRSCCEKRLAPDIHEAVSEFEKGRRARLRPRFFVWGWLAVGFHSCEFGRDWRLLPKAVGFAGSLQTLGTGKIWAVGGSRSGLKYRCVLTCPCCSRLSFFVSWPDRPYFEDWHGFVSGSS